MSTYVSRAGISIEVDMTDEEYEEYCEKYAIFDRDLDEDTLNLWVRYEEPIYSKDQKAKRGFVLLLAYAYDDCDLDFVIDFDFLDKLFKETKSIMGDAITTSNMKVFSQVYYNGTDAPLIFEEDKK